MKWFGLVALSFLLASCLHGGRLEVRVPVGDYNIPIIIQK